jgi:hypothetical protein
MSEITVVLKDSDRTYKHGFLIYEPFTVSEDDPVICACIEEAKMNFNGDPESVHVKIHMEIK